MNPIVFALRHPITMIMLVVALVGGGALALTRMRIDIFPPINQPSDLRVHQLRRLRPRPDGRAAGQPVRVLVPVRGRRPQHGVEVHPAGRGHQAVVLPRHGHVQGDGPGRQRGVPGPGDAARRHAAAAHHADGRRQRAGRLPGVQKQDPLARRDRRPGPVPGPALAPDVRPRHRRHRAVRLGHPRHHRQRRSRQAAHLQPHAPGRGQRRQRGQRHQPLGQPLRPGRHAAHPQQRHGSRAEGCSAASRSSPAATSTCATWRKVADATDLNYGYALVDGRKSIYVPIIKKNTASTLTGGVRHQKGDAGLQERAAGGRGHRASRSTNRRPWSRP